MRLSGIIDADIGGQTVVRVDGAPRRTRDRSTRVKPFVSVWEPEISVGPCDKCHRRSQPRLGFEAVMLGVRNCAKINLQF